MEPSQHHPPTPSSKEEGEKQANLKAPSSSEEGEKSVDHKVPSSLKEGEKSADHKVPSSLEEGVGGGGVSRNTLLKRAAEMRKSPTEPEKRLWASLRRKELSGYKFRRQAIIGNRIVDFFCPAKGLVVEVDGQTHDPEKDAARDQFLEAKTGFHTLRFRNEDMMQNFDGVLTTIAASLEISANRWTESETR